MPFQTSFQSHAPELDAVNEAFEYMGEKFGVNFARIMGSHWRAKTTAALIITASSQPGLGKTWRSKKTPVTLPLVGTERRERTFDRNGKMRTPLGGNEQPLSDITGQGSEPVCYEYPSKYGARIEDGGREDWRKHWLRKSNTSL